MTTETTSGRSVAWVLGFAGMGVPAVVLRVSGADIDPVLEALIYGAGIAGGAFLLSWAAEVAQLDVPTSLAIAILALIAILPEYAIEAVLAWKAGTSFDPAVGGLTLEMERVAANVTGANRLLIGLGWSAVILMYWVKRRRTLDIRGHLSLEVTVLTVATLLTFLIFFMEEVHIVLAGALIALYLVYLWKSSTKRSEEPELVGVAATIGELSVGRRRTTVVVMLLYSAAIILVAAEPFVDSLVDTGLEFGIDEFTLIQWIAPLASESPEIIIAILFTIRANPMAGITTLISAEVNQLTLLVGSMVAIFSLSAGEALSFPLDSRQSAEFLLTSAVSAFAIVLIAPRLIGWRAGGVLLTLFVVHLFFVDEGIREIFAYLYLAMAVGLIVLDRRRVRGLIGGAGD